MTVARVRISRIRVKPALRLSPFYNTTTLECLSCENGEWALAIFSRRGGSLGPWQMQPAGTFVRVP